MQRRYNNNNNKAYAQQEQNESMMQGKVSCCPYCNKTLYARICKSTKNAGQEYWACSEGHAERYFCWVDNTKNEAYEEKRKALREMDDDRTAARIGYMNQQGGRGRGRGRGVIPAGAPTGFQKATTLLHNQPLQQPQPLLAPDDMPAELIENAGPMETEHSGNSVVHVVRTEHHAPAPSGANMEDIYHNLKDCRDFVETSMIDFTRELAKQHEETRRELFYVKEDLKAANGKIDDLLGLIRDLKEQVLLLSVTESLIEDPKDTSSQTVLKKRKK